MSVAIHRLADVASKSIGKGTKIWQYVVILEKARIGADCNICAHVLIENDVLVGDRVTVKSGVQLWDGVRLEDDVFVGPNVSFTNDRFPRSKKYPEKFSETIVEKGASIGAGAVILPCVRIGAGAMVGAGAVVTRSVPPGAIIVGNPARIAGYAGAGRPDENVLHSMSQGTPASVGAQQTAVNGVTLHRLPRITDMRGSVSVGEFEKSVSFTPLRYFLVFGVPSEETRGEHAHHKCQQFLICVRGRCSVVADDGRNRQEFLLDSPSTGLYLPPMIWGIQYRYSADAVLLVFASDYYDANDYIRNYGEFLKLSGAE